jgi:hypothetical protein
VLPWDRLEEVGEGDMSVHPDADRVDWLGDDDGPPTCDVCGGEGEIMRCIDDMCRNSGECFHGDGYVTCPSCKGTGELT